MTAPLLLTEQEAADRLRICARQLRKARQEGRLHYVLNGRSIRYTIDDLESFVDSLRQVEPQCHPAPSSRRTIGRKQRGGQVIPFKVRQRGG